MPRTCKYFFLLLLLLVISQAGGWTSVQGATFLDEWSDDFGGYTLGNLIGQPPYYTGTGDIWQVVSSSYSGQGLYVDGDSNITAVATTSSQFLDSFEYVSLDFQVFLEVVTSSRSGFRLEISDTDTGSVCSFHFVYDDIGAPEDDSLYLKVTGDTNVYSEVVTGYSSGEFYQVNAYLDFVNNECGIIGEGGENAVVDMDDIGVFSDVDQYTIQAYGAGGVDRERGFDQLFVYGHDLSIGDTQSGQFVVVFPYAGQSFDTPAIPVNFSYYFNTTDDYDLVGFEINNQRITSERIVIESSIIGSGQLNFSTTTVVTCGECGYLGRAFMRDSSGSTTPIYSGWRVFYTGDRPDLSFPTLSTGDFASTTVNVGTGGIGTTTLNFVNPATMIPDDVNNLLSTKFPFAFIYDMVNMVQLLASGTSSPNASFELPLGAVHTDPSSGATTSSIVMIDQSDITDTGYISQIRSLVETAILFGTAIASVAMAFKAM